MPNERVSDIDDAGGSVCRLTVEQCAVRGNPRLQCGQGGFLRRIACHLGRSIVDQFFDLRAITLPAQRVAKAAPAVGIAHVDLLAITAALMAENGTPIRSVRALGAGDVVETLGFVPEPVDGGLCGPGFPAGIARAIASPRQPG